MCDILALIPPFLGVLGRRISSPRNTSAKRSRCRTTGALVLWEVAQVVFLYTKTYKEELNY
tara:strand:+ start:56 stop:238 length:183 start_codon:yes stop_codon:yes gene_type:complete